MRILFVSYVFPPGVGGVQSVGGILSRQLLELGHDVRVVTRTPGPGEWEDVPVVRRPRAGHLLRLVRRADVVFHNNISLRFAWPLLAVRRPWVVAHHIWIRRSGGQVAWQDRLKYAALRFATHIAPSAAIAGALPVPAAVIGNPYRDDLFVARPDVRRTRDLVFLGRLVSEKGVDVLVDALRRLAGDGVRPSLTIIGSGPDEAQLRAAVADAGLAPQVTFAGEKTGDELVSLLNGHSVMVVPSRCEEAFGVAALEGIACGCAVVGARRGGLADAIGPCGITFENGDAASLADALRRMLLDAALRQGCREAAPQHLARFRQRSIALAYERVLRAAAS